MALAPVPSHARPVTISSSTSGTPRVASAPPSLVASGFPPVAAPGRSPSGMLSLSAVPPTVALPLSVAGRPSRISESPVPRYPVEPGQRYAIAHRCGGGLAPENTLAAARRSVAAGARHLEVDVEITTDGVCVAAHDPDLRRVTGRRVRVADVPWTALGDLRVGGTKPIPRLEELLEEFPRTRFMIDIKDPRAIEPVWQLVHALDAVPRICLTGLHDPWLARARAVFGPEVLTSMGRDSLLRLVRAVLLGRGDAGVRWTPYLHVPRRMMRLPRLAHGLLARARDHGSELIVWTVDDERTMTALLAMGVDGLITDRPDLLGGLLRRQGLAG